MSFFPRTILLATDGSDEADLATQAAAELSKATASEVHVTYVLPTEADLIGPHAYTDEIRESLLEQAERDARSLLEERAERVALEGYELRSEPFDELDAWLETFRRSLSDRMDRLEVLISERKAKKEREKERGD